MTSPSGTATLAGIAADAVGRWLTGQGVPITGPLRFDVLPGGRSNLTYLVTDAVGTHWILRRPPLSTTVSSAHDVGREFRIMRALQDTPVPVPRMYASCDDVDVLGVPFYLMEYVEGVVPHDRATVERELTPPARAIAGSSIVDLLVQLHAVRPAAVGLGELGRGHDYVGRQLIVWERQLGRLDHDRVPTLRGLADRLRSARPEQVETTIVHGDFRPGNVMLAPAGPVRALLDWELCTLGDPLADLGWLLAYWGWYEAVAEAFDAPTRAPGFLTAAAVLKRYADDTGRSVAHIEFYVAFALWRLAVILAGVRARVQRGAYGTVAPDHRLLDQRIAALIDAAIEAAGR